MVGHFAYLVLVVSMLMRRMFLLRIFVIVSATVAIAYALLWLKDPIGVFWESLLVVVNAVQLAITWHQNRTAKFSDEETVFMQGHLPGLSLSDRRKLLNRGLWISGEIGTELTTQGQPVDHLVYLASGQAMVISGGHPVAVCEPGTFIGEMTALRSANLGPIYIAIIGIVSLIVMLYAWFIGEPLSPRQIGGAGMVVVGLMLVNH